MLELLFAFFFGRAYSRRAKADGRSTRLWFVVGFVVFAAASNLFAAAAAIALVLAGIYFELAAFALGLALAAGVSRAFLRYSFHSLHSRLRFTTTRSRRIDASQPLCPSPNPHDVESGPNWFNSIQQHLPGVRLLNPPRIGEAAILRLEAYGGLITFGTIAAALTIAFWGRPEVVISMLLIVTATLYSFGISLWRPFEPLAEPLIAAINQHRRDLASIKDPRQPVLLLRSFSTENARMSSEQDDLHATRLRAPVGQRFEQILVSQLALRIGPVVAIGNPGDQLLVGGATRMYSATEDWRQLILALMKEAQLIILQLSPTVTPARSLHVRGRLISLPETIVYELSDGFLFELSAIATLRFTSKTAIISVDVDGGTLPIEQFGHMISKMPDSIRDQYKDYDLSERPRILSATAGAFGVHSHLISPQDQVAGALASFATQWTRVPAADRDSSTARM